MDVYLFVYLCVSSISLSINPSHPKTALSKKKKTHTHNQQKTQTKHTQETHTHTQTSPVHKAPRLEALLAAPAPGALGALGDDGGPQLGQLRLRAKRAVGLESPG